MVVHEAGAPDAHDVLASLRAGTSTSSRLVDTALRAIAEQNGDLKAFAVVFGDSARQSAAAADAARAKGRDLPLLGLPVGVKADLAVAGVQHYLSPTAQPAAADCPEVAALRAAGAVIVGHTAMSEGALWATTTSRLHGATGNPHHRALSPGGSSGGSAAAVAAGLVAAAVGTDMGGSVRIPAACCGLVGLKPQRGRRPLDSADRRWHGLREPGPIARSARDCALLHSVLGGPPPAIPQTAPVRPLKIAVVLGPGDPYGAVPIAMAALTSLGHDVDQEPVSPPGSGLLLAAAPRYLRAAADEVAALGPDSVLERRTAQAGWGGRLVPRVAVRASARASIGFGTGVRRRLQDIDVLLTPALGAAVPTVAQWSSSGAVVAGLGQRRLAEHTPVWNVTGHPALVMPIWSAAPDRPGGPPPAVQLVGRPWSEPTLLALATALEQATRPTAA